MSISLLSSASEDAPLPESQSVIPLVTLLPSSPVMTLIADEVTRKLDERGIAVEHSVREAEPGQALENTDAGLLLAGLDVFIAPWYDDKQGGVSESGVLPATLTPVAEVVRDHQAFLMLTEARAQLLRTRFSRSHGADGPMSIGGLSEYGHRDHLVAMMLMDASGQEPAEYPYRQYNSLEAMAIALLTEEVDLISIPVSAALQMPLDGGIEIIATSSSQPQDVLRNVPTLLSARIDMQFTNYIGLYKSKTDVFDESVLPISSLATLSSSEQWSDRVFELGLVDDYVNEGNFTVNVFRELSKLQRLAAMLD